VGDWETWTTGGLILGRLGETPVTDPEFYDRSAPVKHLDKLVRPLLLLQGTNDANVPFWESLKVRHPRETKQTNRYCNKYGRKSFIPHGICTT
jgi:hypothetical protein